MGMGNFIYCPYTFRFWICPLKGMASGSVWGRVLIQSSNIERILFYTTGGIIAEVILV